MMKLGFPPSAACGQRLAPVTLERLFAQAEDYGHVRVFSSSSGKPGAAYHVTIVFGTPDGFTLEASSEFRMPLADALSQAIERADAIRASFRGLKNGRAVGSEEA